MLRRPLLLSYYGGLFWDLGPFLEDFGLCLGPLAIFRSQSQSTHVGNNFSIWWFKHISLCIQENFCACMLAGQHVVTGVSSYFRTYFYLPEWRQFCWDMGLYRQEIVFLYMSILAFMFKDIIVLTGMSLCYNRYIYIFDLNLLSQDMGPCMQENSVHSH